MAHIWFTQLFMYTTKFKNFGLVILRLPVPNFLLFIIEYFSNFSEDSCGQSLLLTSDTQIISFTDVDKFRLGQDG